MPELRKDPILGRWVIVASERAARPSDFKVTPVKAKGGDCPFCEGNESVTPHEIKAIRRPNSKPNEKGWQVRVVPNKFPALRIEGNLDKRGEGLYDWMNGIGAHEIIIEAPQHIISMSVLDEAHIQNILQVYQERLIDLKKDERFVFGLIFKNVGEVAGASLEHSHSQLVATPVVPIRIKQEMDGCKTFYDYRGRCLFCDIIAQEIGDGKRVVANDEHFIAINPYVSRFPFETWILPKKHLTHFETISQDLISGLAHMLKNIFVRLEKVLNYPPYNLLVHTTPFNVGEIDYYHWHIEIIPRISRVAGFEWGTGFYIITVSPEDAAKFLREVT